MTGFEFVWVLLGGIALGFAIGYRWAIRRITREAERAELQAWLNGFDR